MPFDSEGRWHPGTSPKQDALRELCRKKKFVLAAGPRFSTKTLGCLHAIVEHGWNTRRGNDCIITISQTVGIDSGVWKDLTDVVIPQWIEGDFGLEWVKEPYTMGVSKKPTCEIVNKYGVDLSGSERKKAGGTTVFQLESLKVEDEVEDRFKPRRYSGIYVPELSTFRKRNTFTTWTECLRLLGLPANEHLFLADTNPSDEGEASWIYQVWFTLLNMDAEAVPPEDRALRDNLGRMDFDISDNIFDTSERIAELISKYHHDPDLYARYIEGQWVTASEDALFYKVYRPGFHEIGEYETPANKEPVMMVPEEGCIELLSGWDLGVTNSAVVIAEKVITKRLLPNPGKPGELIEKDVPILKFLDELVLVGEDFLMEDFVLEFLKKRAFWEMVCGRPGRILWTNWSDRSAFDFVEPVTKRYHHQIVYDASGGLIQLQAADRGPGSVLERVDMWRKFLFDERLFFSRTKCHKLITMNKSIKRGTSRISVISTGSVHKHPFDAGSYIAASEFPNELQRQVVANIIAQRRASESSQAVVVRM